MGASFGREREVFRLVGRSALSGLHALLRGRVRWIEVQQSVHPALELYNVPYVLLAQPILF